jgi:riboflavin kinase/FMN adenylyltransferase
VAAAALALRMAQRPPGRHAAISARKEHCTGLAGVTFAPPLSANRLHPPKSRQCYEAQVTSGTASGRSGDDSGSARGGLVAIGNFDGVHCGHQALLADAADEARRRVLAPIVLTFHPHPAKALGRAEPPVLTRLERKIELVGRVSSAIEVFVERFDAAFASQTPESFAEQVLVAKLSARLVFVGQNFRFGKDRKGDFAELTRLGASLGFETRSHALVSDELGPISSTRIRGAIARGELDEATRLLGRPHLLSGVVVAGDRRGRTLGFPTCNLAEVTEALPPFGVYAVLVDRVDASTKAAASLARGVANIGVRPTVAGAEARPSVEVHLLDHAEDLYGAALRVHLVAMLRPERRFDGLEALKAQIALDAEQARLRLAALAPSPDAGGAWR